MKVQRRRLAFAATALTVMIIAGACAERIIYRNVQYPEPPAAAAGFLGFQDAATNKTVCGNCHVGHQSDWQRTAHAQAWATLAASPGKQTFCEGCHTVNKLGNGTADVGGGWIGANDARYHDVQCESCHGPGLDHVQFPESSQPLASIAVGVNLTTGCGECHNGTHHPFVEEWESSGHGKIVASAAARTECQSCHTAKGALDAWGVTANYKEKSGTGGHLLAITCSVCHDPHGNEASRRGETGSGPTNSLKAPMSGGQLRYSVDVPSEEQNLCMKCHHKRAQPDLGTTQFSRGPHSPEGPLLLGENVGFWFGEIPYDGDKIASTHGTEANPRLCATCHMQKFEVTDKATGQFKVQVVGHRFEALPCIDANGAPTGEASCTITSRSFKGCLGSGCHGSDIGARSAYQVATTRITNLAAQLKAQVDQVRATRPTEFSQTDNRWTVAEGADFNRQLAVFPGSQVHNPFLIESLMIVSIREMRDTYGVAVQAGLSLERLLSGHDKARSD